uniref:Uncharacterized protein n=1 Tax=Strigamia maritima TaxID=126957 RepID=T1IRB1_STRMM
MRHTKSGDDVGGVKLYFVGIASLQVFANDHISHCTRIRTNRNHLPKTTHRNRHTSLQSTLCVLKKHKTSLHSWMKNSHVQNQHRNQTVCARIKLHPNLLPNFSREKSISQLIPIWEAEFYYQFTLKNQFSIEKSISQLIPIWEAEFYYQFTLKNQFSICPHGIKTVLATVSIPQIMHNDLPRWFAHDNSIYEMAIRSVLKFWNSSIHLGHDKASMSRLLTKVLAKTLRFLYFVQEVAIKN